MLISAKSNEAPADLADASHMSLQNVAVKHAVVWGGSDSFSFI